jgi:hypothetical protein
MFAGEAVAPHVISINTQSVKDSDIHASYIIYTSNKHTTSQWTSMRRTLACVLAAEANVCRLTQNEQRELQNRMEKKQMKEFMNVSRRSITLPLELMAQTKCVIS